MKPAAQTGLAAAVRPAAAMAAVAPAFNQCTGSFFLIKTSCLNDYSGFPRWASLSLSRM